MKKKTNIFFSFLLAVVAVLGLGFTATNSLNSASAAGVVTITYNINSAYLDEGFSVTTSTDANGKITEFATASKYNGYYLKGWTTVDGSTEAVTTETVFETDTTLYPIWVAKIYAYTITQNQDSTLTVVGATAEEGLSYNLTTTASSLSNALIYINADNVSTDPSTLVFDDYILAADEQITISKTMNISGSITSSNESAIFKITANNDSNITFVNATLKNNNFGTLIDITSTKNIALTLDSVTLNAVANGSPAINTTATTSLALAGNMSHTSTYLYKYTDGMALDLSSNTLSSTDTLKIAVEYVYDNTEIASAIYAPNNNYIEFVSTNTLYKTHKSLSNNNLIVRTSLNVQYDLDGGTLAPEYTIPNLYYKEDYELIALPTDNEISKQYAIFDGWFGVVEFTQEQKSTYGLASTIYYFDTESLNTYLEASANLSSLDTYFKTSLNDFTSTTAITAYQYNDTTTNYNSWANFFMTNNINPKLVAKWNYIEYTISFETNGGESVDPIVEIFGETITSPTPAKTGYTFTGWYIDEDLTTPYTFSTMPAENFTLYAGYTINQYTIIFIKNNDESNSTTTQDYGSTILFPEITKEGHSLVGWYTDAELTEAFEQTTIPADNISIYASWSRNTYTITLDTDGKGLLEQIETLFGDVPTAPENPTFTGYTFHGWFTDKTYQNQFDFTEPTPANNRTAYAKWTVMQYKLTYVFNNGTANSTITKDFGSNIAIPTQPSRNGYSFAGWHSDSALTIRFDFTTTMPAEDLTLYAKWDAKTTIQLSLTTQTVETDSRGTYKVPTNISGFTVQYFVNGEWQIDIPNEIGVYDVRIFRAEDDSYAEYLQVVKNGFTVTQKTLDISWLPITLIIVFIIEIIMVIIVKILRKKKLTQTIIIQTIALPFGLIPETQFVLTIITGALAIFGFIYLIVELVKLHRTIPMKDEANIKYDNRALLEKRGDKSENASISSNVNDLLEKEGLYVHDYSKDDNYKIDDDIIGRADASYTGKISNKNIDEDEE